MLGIILLILLIVFLFGGLGGPYIGAPWTTGYGWGHGGNGLIFVLIVILIVLVLTGRV